MKLYKIAPAVLAAPLFLYVWYFLCRIFAFFRKKRVSLAIRLLCAAAALAAVIPAMNIWGFWALVLLHAAAISAAADLLRLLVQKLSGRKMTLWYGLCAGGLIPVLGCCLVLAAGFWNMGRIVKTEYTVTTEKHLKQGGYDVVFLSDLHFGTTMDAAQLEAVCRRIGESAPDLVLLIGDIVDERTSAEELEEAFKALSGIQSTFGVYYIYGNHDKGRYSDGCAFTARELAETAASCGIRILEDETCVLSGDLTLTGRRDRTDASRDGIRRTSARKLLQDADSGAYHILADHQPRYLEDCAQAGYDLMLSGHTHGGQIWPTGLLTGWFSRETVIYGQEKAGQMDILVSSGIGGWRYPVRTGSRSEYVIVHIREEEAS